MIFTGEGKIDSQSLMGKVIGGIASYAKQANVPVTGIAGGVDDKTNNSYECGVTAVFSINRLPEDFEKSKHKSAENLKSTIDNVLRLTKSVK